MRILLSAAMALTLLAATGKVGMVVDAVKSAISAQQPGGVFDAAQKAVR